MVPGGSRVGRSSLARDSSDRVTQILEEKSKRAIQFTPDVTMVQYRDRVAMRAPRKARLACGPGATVGWRAAN